MEFCIPGFMQKFDLEDVIAHFENCPLLISATTEDKWSRGHAELYEAIQAKGQKNIELKVYPGHLPRWTGTRSWRRIKSKPETS